MKRPRGKKQSLKHDVIKQGRENLAGYLSKPLERNVKKKFFPWCRGETWESPALSLVRLFCLGFVALYKMIFFQLNKT